MIPVKVKNEIKVEVEVKDIRSDIVDVLDDRTDTQENKTIPPIFDSDALDTKQDFNEKET
jgi:hypothetical protein